MNEALMQAVVDAVAFLALSDDTVVDQDAALQQLEHMSSVLGGLGPVERAAFLAFVAARARQAHDDGDQERSEFLRALPEQLGLADGE